MVVGIFVKHSYAIMRTSRQTEDMLYQNTCFYCLSEDMFCGQSEDMFSCQSNCMFHSRSEYMFRANQQTCFGAKTKSFDGDLRSNILCFQSEHVTYLLRRYARAYLKTGTCQALTPLSGTRRNPAFHPLQRLPKAFTFTPRLSL